MADVYDVLNIPQNILCPMYTAPKPKAELVAPADCDLVNVNYSYNRLS